MNLEDLFAGSYRGAKFFVLRSQMKGGRKTAVKDFVDSDLRLVEDQGLLPPTFTLDVVIATTTDSNGVEVTEYKAMRRALFAALDEGTPGELVHPWYGTLPNIAFLSMNVSEDLASLGRMDLALTFTVTSTDGRPIPVERTVGDIESGLSEVESAANASLASVTVTDRYVNNFEAARDKIDSAGATIGEAMSTAAGIQSKIDSFARQLAEHSRNSTLFVSDAQSFADSIISLYDSARGLHQSKQAAYNAFIALFQYGDEDADIVETTLGLKERAANQNAITTSMRALSLSSAYRVGADIDHKTVDDIDATVDALEDQFQQLAASDVIDADVLSALVDIRSQAQDFFEAQKLTAKRIVTVRTNPISMRNLAYKYYGSTSDGEELAQLNGYEDLTFIDGDTEIFTA